MCKVKSRIVIPRLIGLSGPQIFVPVAEPIMMSEILDITAHPRVFGRRRDGIAQTEGKRNFQVIGNIKNSLYLLFYRTPADGAHDMEANPQGIGHEPHVFHYTTQTHNTQKISL